MKKLESSLKNMLIVLTLVSAVAAFLLAYVNNVTSSTIAKINEEALSAGIKSVLNIGADEQIDVAEKEVEGFTVYEVTRVDENQQGRHGHRGGRGNETATWLGTAVKSTDKSGFGGDIEVLVGFNEEGKILGYEVLKHAETPGLGARAGEWFRTTTSGEVKEVGALSKIFFGNPDPAGSHNIIGRDIAQGELKVTKDGGDIDAITASTITSRAFLNAVNNAYKVFKGNVSDANSGATAQN
jgi:electron transport complex protein RnfG